VFKYQLHQLFLIWWTKCIQLGLSQGRNIVLIEEKPDESGESLGHSPHESQTWIAQQAYVSMITVWRMTKIQLWSYQTRKFQVLDESNYKRYIMYFGILRVIYLYTVYD
jgi:hypothetical protein